ncbi:MAG: hypothetical protein GYA21_03945 [Myxococcales bacterium]|nr:hypothetical protein [Myxococcales bacterium]
MGAIVILFPLLCLAAGFSVAFTAREQVRREKSQHRGPYLPGLLCFVGLVVVPLAAVLLYQVPGWSLLYLLDPEALNIWMALAFLAALPVLAAAGFWVGVLLCRGGVTWLPAGLAGLFLVAGVVLLFVFGERLAVVAAGLELEKAPAFFSTPLPAVLAFAIPVLLGGWIFLLVFFEVEGRKIRQAILLRQMPADPLPPAGATSSYPSKAGSFERLLNPGATSEAAVASAAPSAPAKAPSASGSSPKG